MSGLFHPTVASITLRSALGRRRAALFALPTLLLILLTLAVKAGHPGGDWVSLLLGGFTFSVVLPLTALIIGTSVLGAEVDDGSILHLLATPVRRSSILATKFVLAAGLTMALVALPELLAAVIATGGFTPLAEGLFLGTLAGSVIYNALFVMISVVTTRAVAFGLLYVLLWEDLVGGLVSGARFLSVGHYSLGIANAVAHDARLHAGLTLPTAALMGLLVTATTLTIATRRLSHFALRGDPL